MSSSPPSNNGDGDGEVEDQRPRRSKPRKSLKTAESSQQRRDELLGSKAKESASKRNQEGVAVVAEMSQLLDAYVPPPRQFSSSTEGLRSG